MYFLKGEDEISTYLKNIDQKVIVIEKQRIPWLNSLKNLIIEKTVQAPYVPSGGITLRSGRPLQGSLTADAENVLILNKNHQDPIKVKWADMPVEEYLLLLESYIKPAAQLNNPQDFEKAAVDYFRLAVFADWYGLRQQAEEYAAKAAQSRQSDAEIIKIFVPKAK